MKVWQLLDISRDVGLLIKIASNNSRWLRFASIYSNIDTIIVKQNREILDFELPDEYIEEVIKQLNGFCYEGSGNIIRCWKMKGNDIKISYIDIYKKFGSDVLVDILEFGSFEIPQDGTHQTLSSL